MSDWVQWRVCVPVRPVRWKLEEHERLQMALVKHWVREFLKEPEPSPPPVVLEQ